MSFRAVRTLIFLSLSLALPVAAHAQIYFGAYLGANYTHPATVTLDVRGQDIRFDEVNWEAKPFASPQYYGLRVGTMFGTDRRLGIEVEFLHQKVIAKIETAPMQAVVQRYAMTHGMNFLTVNVVSRTPLGGGPLALVARAGAGPTFPHGESTIFGVTQEQYEYAGFGVQAAAGVDVRLAGPLSLMSEYKFTFAKPKITLAEGTGQTTTVGHQIAFGLTFALNK
jgi:hypothetical protein